MVLYLYRFQDLLLFLFCADLRFTRYNISNFATKHILSISIAKNLREFTSPIVNINNKYNTVIFEICIYGWSI